MKANRVLKVPMTSPEDTAGVEAALAAEGFSPTDVRAVMCMTESDGFGRGYASLAFAHAFAPALGCPPQDVAQQIPLIMIGGCSGLVTPYAAVFVDDPASAWVTDGSGGGLSIGVTTTATLDPLDVGTPAMVDAVADAVRSAMADAGIDDVADVHNVQIKTPWPSSSALLNGPLSGLEAGSVGAMARAAGALGVAVALGEVSRADITADVFLRDPNLRSDVASVSAGTERVDAAVLVMGNSLTSASPYRIGHGVLRDGIDPHGVLDALRAVGIDSGWPFTADTTPVEHVFLKSAVDGTDECRGRRHVLRTDYLGPYSWLLGKAVVHATVASIVGDPMMQVSGGGEHQGPPGGGTVAVIAR